MDEEEFKTTWVANKALYRTCLAMPQGGNLIILAPGVQRFGENETADQLIRRYGYRGTQSTLAALASDPQLQENQGIAAHLMHGSPEGRFAVSYASKHLTQSEIESAGYAYLPLDAAQSRYLPDGPRSDGFYTDAMGEPFYFIGHPAAGLWRAAESVQAGV
jgi:hypothetical protein